MKYTFCNPYLESLPKEYTSGVTTRIQFDLPKDERQKFIRLLPDRRDAVFQNTFAILTQKLLTSLNDYGIKFDYNDGDRFKDFITRCIITIPDTIPGDAITGSLRETLPPDDTRGKDGGSVKDSGNANVLDNTPSKVESAIDRPGGNNRTRRSKKKKVGEGTIGGENQ